MACSCGCLSPFLFASYPRPSIFSRDTSYTKGAATGMTMGQIASHTVTEYERRTGYSLGTMSGISDKADQATAQRNDMRRIVRQKRKGA